MDDFDLNWETDFSGLDFSNDNTSDIDVSDMDISGMYPEVETYGFDSSTIDSALVANDDYVMPSDEDVRKMQGYEQESPGADVKNDLKGGGNNDKSDSIWDKVIESRGTLAPALLNTGMGLIKGISDGKKSKSDREFTAGQRQIDRDIAREQYLLSLAEKEKDRALARELEEKRLAAQLSVASMRSSGGGGSSAQVATGWGAPGGVAATGGGLISMGNWRANA